MVDPRAIGVVTVTYNSAQVLEGFIASILGQAHKNFVLYVVDNASSDDTLQRLAQYKDPRIVTIPNRVNVGVAEGNNIGIRMARQDGCGSVLLLNNDTVFESDLFAELSRSFERYECEMVVPKIMFFDDPRKIWCAGGYFNAVRCSGSHFGLGSQDRGQFDVAKAVDYSPTCCMLVKMAVFDRVGLMDPNYFLYFDDTDFCLRAKRAGVRLFYIPSTRLLHKVSSLTGGISAMSLRYITRNHVYYALKNCSNFSLPFYLLALYAYIPAKYLLLLRRPDLFWAAQKAFWAGISLFCSYWTQSRRTLPSAGSL
jgi:GT2 family glycosyltransferase